MIPYPTVKFEFSDRSEPFFLVTNPPSKGDFLQIHHTDNIIAKYIVENITINLREITHRSLIGLGDHTYCAKLVRLTVEKD